MRPSSVERPIAFHYDFIEVLSGAAKISKTLASLGYVVGPPLDISISRGYDLEMTHVISWLAFLVSEHRLKSFFLGQPCTSFSIMWRPRLHSEQVPFGFDVEDCQARTGNVVAHHSFQLMYTGYKHDSAGLIETPYSSYMKQLPSWQRIREIENTDEVRCDSCRFGSPHLESFRFLGLNLDQGRGVLYKGVGHLHWSPGAGDWQLTSSRTGL